MRRRRILRCSHGHVFSHSYWWWYYGGLFTIVRLGFAGYMHCPVGNHWALVRFASASDLTEQERETLERRARLDDRDGIRLTAWAGILIGAGSMAGALADRTWWGLILAAVWIAVFVALLARARRILSTF